MGISSQWLSFSLNSIYDAGYELKNLKMCELGNQFIHVPSIPYHIAKDYFVSLGVDHTSIDINEKDGAIFADLSKPITDITLLNQFDVVTNYGTSEHVDNQYNCFMNIHNLLKKGGLFIHVLPKVGHWEGHCEYFYEPRFYKKLSELSNYTIIKENTFTAYPGIKTDLISAAIMKNGESEFIDQKTFSTLPIIYSKLTLQKYLKANIIELFSRHGA